MKMAVLCLLGIFSFAHDCGDDANGGTTPATTTPGAATGQVWEQVFATWNCTAAGRPPITFEVKRISENGVEQQWSSDGATGTASVHLDALYLENFKGISYDDYGYTEQPAGTLAALDEFNTDNGVAPYHCVR
jgi:hypothetical protein